MAGLRRWSGSCGRVAACRTELRRAALAPFPGGAHRDAPGGSRPRYWQRPPGAANRHAILASGVSRRVPPENRVPSGRGFHSTGSPGGVRGNPPRVECLRWPIAMARVGLARRATPIFACGVPWRGSAMPGLTCRIQPRQRGRQGKGNGSAKSAPVIRGEGFAPSIQLTTTASVLSIELTSVKLSEK